MNKHPEYFLKTTNPTQKHYEALRAFHVQNLKVDEIAKMFDYSKVYFNKICSQFHKMIISNNSPEYFIKKQVGAPISDGTSNKLLDIILNLRDQGMSVTDIQVVLSAKGEYISTRWIDALLKKQGIQNS